MLLDVTTQLRWSSSGTVMPAAVTTVDVLVAIHISYVVVVRVLRRGVATLDHVAMWVSVTTLLVEEVITLAIVIPGVAILVNTAVVGAHF